MKRIRAHTYSGGPRIFFVAFAAAGDTVKVSLATNPKCGRAFCRR
jgi:hypothetical protein